MGEAVLREGLPARLRGRMASSSRRLLGGAGKRLPLGGMRRRDFLGLLLFAVLLGSASLVLDSAQRGARMHLEDRFELRMSLATGFIRSFLDDVAARARAVGEAELAGAEVGASTLERTTTFLGGNIAVLLDADGRLLQAMPPPDPQMIGTNLAQRYRHLAAAVDGQVAVSDVVPSAVQGVPILGVATPFETTHGTRVLSVGYPAGQTPLRAHLRAAIPFATAAVFLVDGSDAIVASNHAGDTDQLTMSPALVAAASGSANGTYEEGGSARYFAVTPVEGTSLRLIAAVPTTALYAPLKGIAEWMPWLVLVALAFVGLYLARVLSALSRSQAELRLTALELQRSNRELQEFASVASHDLQEPLRKIQAFGERLADRSGDRLDEESRDFLDRMQNAAQRMQTLIHELLAYSRVQSRPSEPTPVVLSDLVADVLEDLAARIASSQAAVHVGPLPVIKADPTQMRQLLQNLIANALKFRRPDAAPVVRISALIGRAIEITVADNGIGFDERYLDKIFMPFQRLHGRTEFEGSGMGLAICRRIVEHHGGTLTASSRPGRGSTFLISLPRELLIESRASQSRSS